jgi:hypothetical protein
VVGDVILPVSGGVISVVTFSPTESDSNSTMLELKLVVFPSANVRLKRSVGALPMFSISIECEGVVYPH